MSSKNGQGKGKQECKGYGEYQWMMGGQMGKQDGKDSKQGNKDKKADCGCQGYYYECMEQGQKGKSKSKSKRK